jgi:hypothetical protein
LARSSTSSQVFSARPTLASKVFLIKSGILFSLPFFVRY